MVAPAAALAAMEAYHVDDVGRGGRGYINHECAHTAYVTMTGHYNVLVEGSCVTWVRRGSKGGASRVGFTSRRHDTVSSYVAVSSRFPVVQVVLVHNCVWPYRSCIGPTRT